MLKTKSTQLNCFSPPVMLATLIIEFSLAAYTLVRYKMNELTRLVVITLVMLATFQLCEYFVCTGPINDTIAWSRFGFAAITALPPLGIHIMHVLAGKRNKRVVWTAYLTMAAFAGTFLLIPHAFNSYQCQGNYVIFHLRAHLGGLYWVYYFGWLLTGIGLGVRWANGLMDGPANNQPRLQAIRGLIIGWLVFVVPTATVNVLKPSTMNGIPSIMCGFAVLFALILTLYILPRGTVVYTDK